MLSTYSLFLDDTAPTDISTLSLHDALPICRYGRYRSCGSSSPPTSSRLNSMPTERASTPSSEANQSRPALNMALAASGETEPSDGHMPRGFLPKDRSCEAMASSIWNAASSGYMNGGSEMIAFGSPR